MTKPEHSISTPSDPILDQEASRISSKATGVLLVSIAAVGALFRLHLLGEKSLYVDEAASVMFARLPWSDFGKALWTYEGNMGFYYVLLRGWIHLGDSEVALRGLSVLFAVATIPATYLLGLRLFGRRAGFVAAALLAAHVFHIRYSQEARSYSLVLFLLVLSTYFFLGLVDSPRQRKYWVAYVLISALAVYSQVFALLVLIAQWLSLGFARLRRLGLPSIVSMATALGLLLTPMAMFILLKNKGQIDWIPRPTFRSVVDFGYLLAGNGGKPLLLAYFVSCLVALVGLRPSGKPNRASSQQSWHVKLVVLWLVFPIASTLAVSIRKPLFWDRYLVICVPAIVLLAGHGITQMDRFLAGFYKSLPLAVLIGLSLWSVHQYYESSASGQPGQEDWRLVTRYILAGHEPGDATFFYRASGSRAFSYYVHREFLGQGATPLPVVSFPPDIHGANFNLDPGREQVERAIRGHKRVWLVLYHYEGFERRKAAAAAIQAALNENFRLSRGRVFPGATGKITVLLYVRAPDTPEQGLTSEE